MSSLELALMPSLTSLLSQDVGGHGYPGRRARQVAPLQSLFTVLKTAVIQSVLNVRALGNIKGNAIT